jgi:hypothetical protein
VLVLRNCAVTVSSTGAENQFQGDDNGHVGRPCEVSLAPPYPELFALALLSRSVNPSAASFPASGSGSFNSDGFSSVFPWRIFTSSLKGLVAFLQRKNAHD